MAMKHSGSFVLARQWSLGLALALTVGCSSKSGDGGGANLPTSAAGGGETSAAGAGGAVSGEVRVDGSSTVFPITEAVAEEFGIEHPEVHVAVAFSGTGGGMKKLIAKEIGLAEPRAPSSRGTGGDRRLAWSSSSCPWPMTLTVVVHRTHGLSPNHRRTAYRMGTPGSGVKADQIRQLPR